MAGPRYPNVANIKKCSNDSLKSETSLGHFMEGFSMATDGAAVMKRVAKASISRDMHSPEETWLNCLAHNLNNVMKSLLATYCRSTILETVVEDIQALKKLLQMQTGAGGTIYYRRVTN